MKGLKKLASTFNEMENMSEKVEYLMKKIQTLEKELERLKETSTEGWMSLAKAANECGLTTSALRQKIKHKDTPLPEFTVWRQKVEKGAITVNLKELRNHL